MQSAEAINKLKSLYCQPSPVIRDPRSSIPQDIWSGSIFRNISCMDTYSVECMHHSLVEKSLRCVELLSSALDVVTCQTEK